MSELQKTDKKYLERYANVYTLTRSVPRDRRFNMADWATRDDESECGTAACMAGHAALHPWFRKRGLALYPYHIVNDYQSLYYLRTSAGRHPAEYIGQFFGYDNSVAFDGHPFDPGAYFRAGKGGYKPTPKQAAAFLKRYMLQHWPRADVEAAIAAATATYDADHVHKNADWQKARVHA